MQDTTYFDTMIDFYNTISSTILAGSTLDDMYKTAKDSTMREIILGDFASRLSSEILETLDENQWDIISGDKDIIMIDSDEDYHCPLPDSFIWRYADRLNWDTLCSSYPLSENVLREFKHKVNWKAVSLRSLSNEFIQEHADFVDWDAISEFRELTEDFIELFQDKVNWSLISEHQELSEDFIKRFSHKIDFHTLLESVYTPSKTFIADLLTQAYHD